MQTVTINNRTFHYPDLTIYFYDRQIEQILFIATIETDDEIIAYDDPQLIVEFNGDEVIFKPIWNVVVKQVSANEYVLDER
ncbi:hypothetical protein [Lactobacillus sp. Sy-1]|uniref:hypothetical protein n=1 Tax=Lactobacillus sp. Sy-1 TaxID=2109645 RepID=UPI001C5AFA7E|nr:hypothetical protein [Lactobacillus sp. Sy-1]MBW1606381.1 hypothetical protein [Lactobacillus sp. Sy-1]